MFDSGKDFLCTALQTEDVGAGIGADVTVVVTLDVAAGFDGPETINGIWGWDFACDGADCAMAQTLTGIEPCATSVSFDASYQAGQ